MIFDFAEILINLLSLGFDTRAAGRLTMKDYIELMEAKYGVKDERNDEYIDVVDW